MRLPSIKKIDKLISGKFFKQIQVFLVLVLVLLGFFWWIASKVENAGVFEEGGKTFTNVFWWVYIHFTYPGHLIIDSPEHAPKWLAVIITVFGMIFFEGAFIGLIVHAIRERREIIKRGLARYNFENHYVIIGADEVIVSLVQNLLAPGKKGKKHPQIVVLTKKNAEIVTEVLESNLQEELMKNIYVLFGDFVLEEYKQLALNLVKEIYIIGDDIYQGVNNENIEIAYDLARLLEKDKHINCYINLPETTSLNLLKKFSFSKNVTDTMFLHPFNIYQGWARQLWGSIDLLSDAPAAWFEPQKNAKITAPLPKLISELKENTHVRVVILGFTEMGYALLEHTLEMAHFNTGQPTQIAVIDPNMKKNINRFTAEFPEYRNIYDCRVEFIESDINDAGTRDLLSQWQADAHCRMVLFSCFSDPDTAFSTAALLPPAIIKSAVPVFIYQQSGKGFFHLLGADEHTWQSEFRNGRFFGWRKEHSGLLKIREELARGIHEEYIEQAKLNGKYNPQLPNFFEWNALPENFKWSNRYQADSFLIKLARINKRVVPADNSKPLFIIEDEKNSPETRELARMEHDRWCAERFMNGWTYGSEAKKENKISDCLVPFEQLSEVMQGYDYNAVKAIPGLLREYCKLDIE